MSHLELALEVIELADCLGLSGAPNVVDAILNLCRTRLDSWVAEAGGVTTIGRLEELVTRKLQMVFEEVRSDDDFDRIKAKYATGKRDFVFAAIWTKFDGEKNPTYGALVRRQNVAPDAPDRYVAVIDCRGPKSARRFFTRWHEIAHRLTTDADPDEPAYRSEHDPIERLMDEIAATVGFYEPIFRPAFDAEMRGRPRLTFEIVENIRRYHFPDASFQSVFLACQKTCGTAVVYLEAAPAHKAGDRKDLDQGAQWLFEESRPQAQIRAVQVIPNALAQRTKLFIAPNMRVPESSLINRLFQDAGAQRAEGVENLSTWEHSRGKRLADVDVWIEARKVGQRIIANIQPLT